MGNEQSKVVPLIRRDDERSLRELIAKHGTSVLAASYEHKDNDHGWPSFGAYLLYVAVECEAVNCLKVISQHVDVNTKNKGPSAANARDTISGHPPPPPPPPQQVNPWEHETYLKCFPTLHLRVDPPDLLAQCFMHGMLTREQYRCIQEKAPSKQTDDILIAISTTQKNFSKFLKILHSDERGLYADMLKDLDTILTAEGHPPPPPPPPQQVNHWESPQFLRHVSTLLDRFDAGFIRQCYSRQMITRSQYIDICAEKVPSEQKKGILAAISGVPKNFTTFLDILRSHEIDLYSDILEDLESIPRA